MRSLSWWLFSRRSTPFPQIKRRTYQATLSLFPWKMLWWDTFLTSTTLEFYSRLNKKKIISSEKATRVWIDTSMSDLARVPLPREMQFQILTDSVYFPFIRFPEYLVVYNIRNSHYFIRNNRQSRYEISRIYDEKSFSALNDRQISFVSESVYARQIWRRIQLLRETQVQILSAYCAYFL